jgi:hypothetical protein
MFSITRDTKIKALMRIVWVLKWYNSPLPSREGKANGISTQKPEEPKNEGNNTG